MLYGYTLPEGITMMRVEHNFVTNATRYRWACKGKHHVQEFDAKTSAKEQVHAIIAITRMGV